MFSCESLKSPVYAGIFGGVLYLMLQYVMNRWFRDPNSVCVPNEKENMKQAVLTGIICAVVMYMANRKNSSTLLSETFD
jgi:zinc transporter ZupT